MMTDEEILFMYGNNAVISRTKGFTLVHLDKPTPELQLKRENASGQDWTFAKLGRMEPQEFVELVPAALELLEKHGLLSADTAGKAVS